MDANPQNFANHTRYDTPFHFFLIPVVAINVIVSIYELIRYPSIGAGWLLVLAVAALVAMVRFRNYATRLQDRIIRLEERARLQSLLAEPLRSRIGDLSDSQLIGLRFASDAELPALMQRALNEKLSRKDIKKAVANWRADYSRV